LGTAWPLLSGVGKRYFLKGGDIRHEEVDRGPAFIDYRFCFRFYRL